MANKNAAANGVKTRFTAGSGDTAARRAGRKGGKKTAENAAAFHAMRDACRDALTAKRADLLAEVLYLEAANGNMKAFELLRDTAGERPTQIVSQNVKAEVDAISDVDLRLLRNVANRLKKAEKEKATV